MPERTFVFADLAGFTALTEAHGDAAAADLALRFEQLSREALCERGTLVKTIGDAVLVAALDPEAALSFACKLDHVRNEVDFPLIRVGLHHGDAVRRGEDWFGTAVNTAARVAAMSGLAQTLCTEEVARTAEGCGHGVEHLGPRRLKNLREPVDIYSLRLGDEVRGDFDPVCRMRVVAGNEAGSLRHEGRLYRFCSMECAARFAGDPGGYALP